MFPEWKTIAFLISSYTANSPLAIVREGLQRSDSRTTWRSRSPLATWTTGSGLTLLLIVWSGATQFTKLLPSSKETEEEGPRRLHHHTRHYISLQSLLAALSLPHLSGQPRACLQSTTTWTNFIKDPVLPIEHCTLRCLGGHFCDVENSEAFVCGHNRTL